MNTFDREVEELEQEYERGNMTREEFTRAMRDLEGDYRDAVFEAARDAYDRELDRY